MVVVVVDVTIFVVEANTSFSALVIQDVKKSMIECRYMCLENIVIGF